MKTQIINAAGLLLALGVHGQQTVSSGSGFGTYYYDVQQVETCGTSFAAQNKGPLECSLVTALSLDQVNSNYVVAMNHTQLVGDMAAYCGKKVIVSVNGKPSSLPLFIGDGCARCAGGSASSNSWDPNGAPGLDFSYSVLSQLSSDACAAGHIDITWEIVDESIFTFDTNGSGIVQQFVAAPGGGSNTQPTTTVASPAQAAPTVERPPAIQTSASGPGPTNVVGPVVLNAVVPTTMVTVTSQTTTTSSTSTTTTPSIPAVVSNPTIKTPSGSCSTGAWQCNGDVLEQCLTGSWAPRVTCSAGMTCQGDTNPYCAPPGFGQL